MTTSTLRVPYTYLSQEFGATGDLQRRILEALAREMNQGRYTLGPAVQEFEERFAEFCGTRYAVGVNSGTDALKLSLRAVGVGPGDGVITVPNTFVATVGAILEVGAIPIFQDIGPDFLMLPEEQFRPKPPPKYQLASYPKYRIPVHWGGNIARSSKLHIEDACQAIGATLGEQPAGSLGLAGAFSLHPLKNLNVMGDGGMITTNDEGLAQELRLLRNHGLQDRDTCVRPGYNSRLDTIQAIVGLEVLRELPWVTECRIANARVYDAGLKGLREVHIPPRDPEVKQVYHLYQIIVERRTELLGHLQARGIEAKVHYPIPLHLQPGLKFLGYQEGDFPGAEEFAGSHITLPVHQYLTNDQLAWVIESIREFYRRGH